jgi:hypothetical protein
MQCDHKPPNKYFRRKFSQHLRKCPVFEHSQSWVSIV